MTDLPPDLASPLHGLVTLFLMNQSRVTNIPLFTVFEIQFLVLRSLKLSDTELTLTSLLLQHGSFFAFGGSNAISSIDLSSGYNGIDQFNVLAVGTLTFCANWAGSIWWTSSIVLLLSIHQDKQVVKSLMEHLNILTAFVSTGVLFVMLACMTLRAHLFIWTVFSPKYLYSMAWNFGQHLFINVGYGSVLYWMRH